jgi:hypothetical protein
VQEQALASETYPMVAKFKRKQEQFFRKFDRNDDEYMISSWDIDLIKRMIQLRKNEIKATGNPSNEMNERTKYFDVIYKEIHI